MVAAYGPGVEKLPYELYTQLWLNLERQRLRRASEVALGLGATGSKPLPREWFEALTLTKAEADEMQYRSDSERQDARVKAKLGWPS